MAEDETEADAAKKLARVQLLTCRCCKISWASPLALRGHLLAVAKSVADKLAELARANL